MGFLSGELVAVAVGALFFVIPIAYIFYKNGENKFIFICSSLGVVALVQSAFSIISFALVWLNLSVLPSHYPEGAPDHMLPFLTVLELIGEYWYIALCALSFILYIICPVYLYKRYQIFGHGNQNSV